MSAFSVKTPQTKIRIPLELLREVHSAEKDAKACDHFLGLQPIINKDLQSTLTTPHQQHVNFQKSHSTPVSAWPPETRSIV